MHHSLFHSLTTSSFNGIWQVYKYNNSKVWNYSILLTNPSTTNTNSLKKTQLLQENIKHISSLQKSEDVEEFCSIPQRSIDLLVSNRLFEQEIEFQFPTDHNQSTNTVAWYGHLSSNAGLRNSRSHLFSILQDITMLLLLMNQFSHESNTYVPTVMSLYRRTKATDS